MDWKYLIAMNHVTKIRPSADLIEKEQKESELDLTEAKKELEDEGYKWAIVKAYYSMFHAAKAVLFALGLKERSHFAVAEVLEALSKAGKLESRFVMDFKAAMSAREGADYHYLHDKSTAEELVSFAEEFVDRMNHVCVELNEPK